MWPSRRRIALGVASGAIAVGPRGQAPQSFPYATSRVPARPADREATGLRRSIEQALAATVQPSGDLVVAVASDVARHWVQQPPRGASSLEELRLVATHRFIELTGEDAAHWHITGDWRVDSPFLCAAIPRWMTESCVAALGPKLRITSIQTSLGLALGSSRLNWPKDGWWCLSSPSTTAVGQAINGRLETLRTVLSTRDSVSTQDEEPGLLLAQQEAARACEARLQELHCVDLRPGAKAKPHTTSNVRVTRAAPDHSVSRMPEGQDVAYAEAWIAAQLALNGGAIT